MTKHLLAVFAFIIVSFGVQGASHFVINSDHYASIGFMRGVPVIPMGIAAMIVQGLIVSFSLSRLVENRSSLRDWAFLREGVVVSLAFGLFLASYIVLAEPAKFSVPSILDWVSVEGTASAVQFVFFGLLLGAIHRRFAQCAGVKL